MKRSLVELEAIMSDEVNQLSCSRINPVLLQTLTDNKSQLLSTIQYYDELRYQFEQQSGLAPPYHARSKLFTLWQAVSAQVLTTRALNLQIEQLLQGHLNINQHMQKMVDKVGHNTCPLYSSTGESDSMPSGRKYNISI
jgi:flagella synthesis protein FlgN